MKPSKKKKINRRRFRLVAGGLDYNASRGLPPKKRADYRVYGLVDPLTDQLRYVGGTDDPRRREYEHLRSQEGTVTEDTRLGDWVRKLRRWNLAPKIVWMERCPNRQALDLAEDFWVMYHRENPEDDAVDGRPPAELLNELDGGPAVTKTCFVALMNGFIAHDGRRWRTETVLRRNSAATLAPQHLGSVLGVDCAPDKLEVFERDGARWLNVYTLPRVKPYAGKHPRIDALLRYLVDHDEAGVCYLVHWLARKVQDPGQQSMTAVVLQGEQGTGKDTFALIVMEMIGRENCARIGQAELDTSFNATFADKLFVVADEVINSDNIRDTSSALKQLVTDATIQVNQKHVPVREIPNRTSWLFTSNATVPVRIEGEHDRRYSVFRNMKAAPPEHKAMLATFYGKGGLSADFISTELAAFMHTLTTLKVDRQMLAQPFDNEARRDVSEAGQSSVDAFAEELRQKGLEQMANDLGYGTAGVTDCEFLRGGCIRTNMLYSMYRDLSTERGHSYPFHQSKFIVELKRFFPGMKKTRLVGQERGRGDCRQDGYDRPWGYSGLPISKYEKTQPFVLVPREKEGLFLKITKNRKVRNGDLRAAQDLSASVGPLSLRHVEEDIYEVEAAFEGVSEHAVETLRGAFKPVAVGEKHPSVSTTPSLDSAELVVTAVEPSSAPKPPLDINALREKFKTLSKALASTEADPEP